MPTVYGSIGNDTINGTPDNDILYGWASGGDANSASGSDNLYGNASNDNLYGGTGNDILDGGTGNDILDGGTGNDILSGGTFSDILDGGNGLQAVYYDNLDLTGPTVTQVNPTVNYDWGGGSPDAGIGPDTFSARWTGQVQAQASETYTFYTQSDDGVRLWVNDQLLIDNWTDHPLTENNGTIQLAAGQKYNIRIEFYENGGDAAAKLLWSSPSTPKAVIPQVQLYSQPIGGSDGNDTLQGGTGNDRYLIDSNTDGITENLNAGTDTVESTVSYTLGDNLENLALSGSSPINGTGNSLDNVISGNAANNILQGGAGNDSLSGGAGNDILDGGDGLQAVYYDNLDLTGPTVTQVNPTVNYNWGQGSPDAGIGADTFSVRWTGQVQAQYSELYTFYARSDDGVRLWVNDQLLIDNWTDHSLTENNGTIALQAGQKYNIRMEFYENGGDATANLLWSSSSTPKAVIPQAQLYSQPIAGTGNDSLSGGAGHDTYIIDSTGDTITENLNEGTDTVQSSVSFNLTGQYIENLTLTGSSNINGTGNSLNNTLTGNSGNNILIGGNSSSGASDNDTLNGGAGNDTLQGGTGNDRYLIDSNTDGITENLNAGTDTVESTVSYTLGDNLENLTLSGSSSINGTGNSLDNLISGNAANNSLDGAAGSDMLEGSDGNDTLNGSDGDDTLYGSDGNDLLNGGIGKDLSEGSFGSDLLNGGAGDDTLDGSYDDDILDGGDGDDYLLGGFGNDLLDGSAGNDNVIGSHGKDSLNGNDGSDSLDGSFGNDLLNGGAGDDYLNGSHDEDTLNGDDGNDSLDGGFGNDLLSGSSGSDVLTGGKDADIFYFDEFIPQQVDVITDFADNELAGDKIQIKATGFGIGLNEYNRFTLNSSTGELFFDQTQFASLQQGSTFNISSDLTIV